MIFETFGTIHWIFITFLLGITTAFWILKSHLKKRLTPNGFQNKTSLTSPISQKLQNNSQNLSQNSSKLSTSPLQSVRTSITEINEKLPELAEKKFQNTQNFSPYLDFPIVQFILNSLIIGFSGHILYYFGGHFVRGTFTLSKYLPLHICNLSVYLLLIALISLKLKKTWSNNFATLVYYWSFVPAILAFIFPDLQSNFVFNFEFIEFFWSHSLIILGCFFLLFFANLSKRYRFTSLATGILTAFSLILIYPLNLLLGSNYMYLNRLTATGPMSLFPNPPLHLVVFVILLFVFYNLQFVILRLFSDKDNKK